MDASDFSAVVGGITGAVALSVQAFNIIRKRKAQKQAIETALDHQPEVRRQLELGNIGEAVRHLNAIIESQARHIDSQDKIINGLKEENKELRKWRERHEELYHRNVNSQ